VVPRLPSHLCSDRKRADDFRHRSRLAAARACAPASPRTVRRRQLLVCHGVGDPPWDETGAKLTTASRTVFVQQPGRARTAAYAVLRPVGDDVAYGRRCSQSSFNRGAWEVKIFLRAFTRHQVPVLARWLNATVDFLDPECAQGLSDQIPLIDEKNCGCRGTQCLVQCFVG
jgi:hypothetical protein